MDEPFDALCLTITAYKKPGMDFDEYVRYMRRIHAAQCGELMEKYGVLEYTQTHCNEDTRQQLREFYGPDFGHFSDYDCIVQITFKKLEDFVKLQKDPYFVDIVFPDHATFADIQRTTMTIGKKKWFVKEAKTLIKNHTLENNHNKDQA